MHREISSHGSRVSHDSGEEVCAGLRTCTFRSLNFVTPAIDLPKPALMCRASTVRPSNPGSEDAASRCGFVQRRARFRCHRHGCSYIQDGLRCVHTTLAWRMQFLGVDVYTDGHVSGATSMVPRTYLRTIEYRTILASHSYRHVRTLRNIITYRS